MPYDTWVEASASDEKYAWQPSKSNLGQEETQADHHIPAVIDPYWSEEIRWNVN